ncbi:MAG TPA: aconitate hydratase AcnA [Spirochaetia bacterium]|nr:aconitate hydratase AcnA [Spirochaetia bacterium]
MSTSKRKDPFGTVRTIKTLAGRVSLYSLASLQKQGVSPVDRMPFAARILAEAVLRAIDGTLVTEEDLRTVCGATQSDASRREFPFMPARVIMQDFTGVPAIADLAAMRDAMAAWGGDPSRINPVIPVDLVIDHSVQVDRFASRRALASNGEREIQRNSERYRFLRWGAGAFNDFHVVPPATGIVHQVNLEHIARVVQVRDGVAFPDTVVGTDSHTTMINGIGVLGWGVGGIEAEAALLGQPLFMLVPPVVGVRLSGSLRPEATATDLVLTLTEMLRARGVVEKIVEFFGPGLETLTVADRATVANMSPEYGATAGFFPVDGKTLAYLRETGRAAEMVDLVERYCKEQQIFRQESALDIAYDEVFELDISTVEPSIAGPRRPQDRIPLSRAKSSWREAYPGAGARAAEVDIGDGKEILRDGSVVIAAITSCTNTSNPAVMIGAGLLARNAVQLGLRVPARVKTSLAPGSRVVTRYLDRAGLTPYLEALGFHVVGYGCTTCIGNSGPLPEPVSAAIRQNDLVAAAVLSGNRNFEGRIHPEVRANYLASPPLVVAYALAGTMDIDLQTEPLGMDRGGRPVFLREIWPSREEIDSVVRTALSPEMFRDVYASVFTGDEAWQTIDAPGGGRFAWDEKSTYIRRPPFFDELPRQAPEVHAVRGARVLALLGDSVTTDHISPAGDIAEHGPAGAWLTGSSVSRADFNTYGSRRGNHEVMIRGTFANIRIRNALVPGVEGGFTLHLPEAVRMPIYDAAMRYRAEGVPLLVIAGEEYGTGSSRDWAAKGTLLLGIRAVIAVSFERIHRSNLVGMGVLPLQFMPGESAASIGLSGKEEYAVDAPRGPRQVMVVHARAEDGSEKEFKVVSRIDTDVEMSYYSNGGILPAVLRGFIKT